jgi:hypothetical protein
MSLICAAVWIAGELGQEPAIAAALVDDRPVAAELRINGFPMRLRALPGSDVRSRAAVPVSVVDVRSAGPPIFPS